MSSIVQRLTEGVISRDVKAEGQALLAKWEKTGLLEGLSSDHMRNGMAILLENQAKQLLKESTSMSNGDVEGFAAVAFPLVRRVFGNLIANDLVSVQPMSLPSGLIFFLDFTYNETKRGAGAVANASLYGQGKVGSQLTGGADLTSLDLTNGLRNSELGFYSLNNGYASPTGSVAVQMTLVAARSGSGTWSTNQNANALPTEYSNKQDGLILGDVDLSGSSIVCYTVPKASYTNLNTENLIGIHTILTGSRSGWVLVRRLTRDCPVSGSSKLLLTYATNNSGSVDTSSLDVGTGLSGSTLTFTYPLADAFTAGGALGSTQGTSPWGLEFSGNATGLNVDIPEIDIKIDSVAVTAITKKLKAVWTPELGQDLNAYHNLDAEVELTSILSEQIALEIDQEILNDLVKGASAGTYFWSRRPGKFVNRLTGADVSGGTNPPDFTGNVSMWYETLLETVNDVSAQIHRKVLRGGATFIVCSPEVANLLEFTAGFRASTTADEEKGEAGAVKVGSINKKWDVYVDPYFVRNLILVGRKGSSFLESGYAFCPYVPLQVTPTIFNPTTLVPTKGVLTRYAKRMYRSDLFGLVVVLDLLG